jgi:hypothetical protein
MKEWGVTLIFIGLGSFLLPMIGLQFRLLNLFGGSPAAGMFVAAAGGVLLGVGFMKDRAQISPVAKPTDSGRQGQVTTDRAVSQPQSQPIMAGIRCAACGAENTQGDQFCGSCGAILAQIKSPSPPSCVRCGAPLSLDERFCGNCGNPRQPSERTLVTTEISGRNIGLFPLYGVTLGKTTVKQLAMLGERTKSINKQTKKPYTCYTIHGTDFWYNEAGVSDHMYIAKGIDSIPNQWEALDFDWGNSYNHWVAVLKRLGFSITVEQPPQVVKYSGHDSFSAKIVATRQTQQSIKIELGFNYSEGTTTESKDTLYNIRVSVP